MFSTLLRSQARNALLTVARTAAVPASRSLSMAVSRHAILSAATVVARIPMTRAFQSSRDNAKVPPSNLLYIGNMPWDLTTEDIKDVFSEFGAVVTARIVTHADGRSRGFGYVEFASVDEATAAMNSAAAEPIHIGGRDLALDFAVGKQQLMAPNKKLHFAGFSGGEAALRDFMGSFKGNIVSVYYLRDGTTGERLNTGFIEFNSIEESTEAMNAMNGTELDDGGNLSLSFARQRRIDPRRDSGSDSRYPDRRNSGYERRDRDQYDGNRNSGRRDYQSRRDY